MSEALDLLAGLVLDDGRRWGEAAVPFQWQDAEAVLDLGGPKPYNYLTRSRGGSKTTDLAGVTIAAMLAQAPARARLYGLASDLDQGRLLVDAVAGFAARTDELRGALDVGAYRATATRSGAVLDVLAANAPSAWGLRPWLLVVDELAAWGTTGAPRRIWEAASSAVAKLLDARLVVLTTAGDPAHWSRKVLDHALADPLWRVQEVAGPAPWLDRERLAEQRRRLPDSLYRRLFENEWVASEDRLASPDDLAACVTLAGPLPPQPYHQYVIGLDIGLKADATVAAIAHAEPILGGEDRERTVGVRIVLDRMEVWQGSRSAPVQLREVEEWLEAASRTYNHAPVRYDPYQAMGSAQRLSARGVGVDEYVFHPASVGRLAATLLTLVREHALDLPDDPELLDELANLRLRETSPGVLRLDHDTDRHDDRSVSLALAATALVERPLGGGDLRGDVYLDRGETIRDWMDAGSIAPSIIKYDEVW